MLKIDMHVHTWYSDSTGSVEEVLEVAHRKGLDGIAITDHGTLRGVYEALEKRDSLIVIPGEEVETIQGEVLALGIKKAIPKHLPINDAIRRIHIQGGVAIIPHPTVHFFSKLREKDLETLSIDGLEVFSAISPSPWYYLKKNLQLARKLNVGMTAGSDSHFPETIGDAYTIVYSKSRDSRDILRAIKLGHTFLGGGPSKLVFKLKMVRGLLIDLFEALSLVKAS